VKEAPLPRTVVITGASAGLGAALATAYAAPGRKMVLIARNQTRLDDVATLCRTNDANVEIIVADVTDPGAMATVITGIANRTPIDLLIANAGVFTGHGPNGTMESADDIIWMNRVNLEGVTNTVQPALAPMRARKSGHIAIIGSLAALQPLPDAPGYSASKAAVMAYGEALREYLIPDGLTVSLVYPGHIDTAQVSQHVGALPNLLTPQQAATIIKRRLDQKRTFIAFPWQLLWLIRASRAVPWQIRALAGKDFRFHVRRDP
jgi:short-subunit dehydrogenase